MRLLLALLLLACPASAAKKKKAKEPVTALFQLGGVVWQADYYSHTVNGKPCVADQGVLLCGPDWMETDDADFLAWAKLIRGPELWFRRRDFYLGTNVLAGLVFEGGLKAPDFVFYWKDGWDRNLYLRLPWPWRLADFEAWVKGDGRARWNYIVEHHQEKVFDPAKRKWHPGQFNYDSLKKDGRPHSSGETLIVFQARPQKAQPQAPRQGESLGPLKLSEDAIGGLSRQVQAETKALQEHLGKVQTERDGLKEESIGGPDNEFIKQEEKRLDKQAAEMRESIRRSTELLQELSAKPSPLCSDCE